MQTSNTGLKDELVTLMKQNQQLQQQQKENQQQLQHLQSIMKQPQEQRHSSIQATTANGTTASTTSTSISNPGPTYASAAASNSGLDRKESDTAVSTSSDSVSSTAVTATTKDSNKTSTNTSKVRKSSEEMKEENKRSVIIRGIPSSNGGHADKERLRHALTRKYELTTSAVLNKASIEWFTHSSQKHNPYHSVAKITFQHKADAEQILRNKTSRKKLDQLKRDAVFLQPLLTRMQLQQRQTQAASHRARTQLEAEKKKREQLEKENEILTHQISQNASPPTSFSPAPIYNPYLQQQLIPPPAPMAAARKTTLPDIAAETDSDSDSDNEKLRRFVEVWTHVQRQNKRL